MEAKPVDPRDPRWEHKPAAYRVFFWELTTGSASAGKPNIWGSDEYELTGANDVVEVLDWARGNAHGRGFTLYALVDRGANRGLVHLMGEDPTQPKSSGTA